jgi:SAM-dependent methyltransferase
MKIRDSGMPEEQAWNQFFSPVDTLKRLRFPSGDAHVLDLGCGYGTFSIAAAKLTSGVVHALDIDRDMLATVEAHAKQNQLANVRTKLRDFVSDGTALPDESVSYVMLFNILHAEEPGLLLREANRTLRKGGLIAVMHWVADARTPRGPPLEIRPSPDQCAEWIDQAGFVDRSPVIDLPPFHFGMYACRA